MYEIILAVVSAILIIAQVVVLVAFPISLILAVIVLSIVTQRVTWTSFERRWLLPYILQGIKENPHVKTGAFMVRYLESARARGLIPLVKS